MADLIAETVASAWCERGSASVGTCDEIEIMRHARATCTRWMALHRHEVHVELLELLAVSNAGDTDVVSAREQAYSWAKARLWELPKQQRHAVWFRDLWGISFLDLAYVLDCSVSSAKTHYRRGIATLRRKAEHLQVELRDGL